MRRIKSKDTGPEMIVRRLLHKLGYRYRLHAKELPGKPDIVFRKRKKAVFVHGCFWHLHDDPACKDGRSPRSRSEYWGPKLERNVANDRAAQESLAADGWKLLVIWECELKQRDKLEERLVQFLEE